MSHAADLTIHRDSLELEKIDFDAAFDAWDDHDRWAVTQQLIAEGWTYIPQFGSHAGHFVSPTWAAKHEIPPQPDAKDVVAYADWIVELRLFSAIYDQDLEEEGHIVYFP